MYIMNKIINWHKAWCEKWRQAMKMSHYGTYWVSFFKGVILVLLILALTGCSIGGEKKIKLFQIEQPREKLDYPMPTPLQLEEIKLQRVFDNLGTNLLQILRWADWKMF